MSCASHQHLRLPGFRCPRRASSSPWPAPAACRSQLSYTARFFLFISLGENIRRRNHATSGFFVALAARNEKDTVSHTASEVSNSSHKGQPTFQSVGEEGNGDVHDYASADIDVKQKPEAFDPSISGGQLIQTAVNRRRRRTRGGVLVNTGLMTSLVVFLLVFDCYSWRIAGQNLKSFYFTRTFLISAGLSGFAGFLYVPMVDKMKIHQILRAEGPSTHSSKRGTPTMGGLFFIPIGIVVAKYMASYNCLPVYGSILATLGFAMIGLVDDLLSCIKSHNYGLPGWIKLCLQAVFGLWFSFWFESTYISMPHNMILSVHLPQPFGLIYLGKYYLALAAFCFAAMGNGVNLTDGLDGLAGGVAAWAFIGMSVAVLAISPDLAVFGASLSGACVGFLFHNRHKASIFMGDTGSLALGGALAAMAFCTGMFLPLFISSGVFVAEVLSVILQVASMKVTRKLYGVSRRIFRMSPVHHHFELCGFREPVIVASAYFLSCILALIAGYVGIIST